MSDRAPTSEWADVATLDDLWEGDILEVTTGPDVVLLVHLAGGELRAYQGVCPHSEFPLAMGDFDGDVLTCAGHGWEFNLRTGHGVNPADCLLYRFDVKLTGEQVSVCVPADDRPHYNRCRQ
jgi:toluene monooxygenase system ferredoxin subunit